MESKIDQNKINTGNAPNTFGQSNKKHQDLVTLMDENRGQLEEIKHHLAQLTMGQNQEQVETKHKDMWNEGTKQHSVKINRKASLMGGKVEGQSNRTSETSNRTTGQAMVSRKLSRLHAEVKLENERVMRVVDEVTYQLAAKRMKLLRSAYTATVVKWAKTGNAYRTLAAIAEMNKKLAEIRETRRTGRA